MKLAARLLTALILVASCNQSVEEPPAPRQPAAEAREAFGLIRVASYAPDDGLFALVSCRGAHAAQRIETLRRGLRSSQRDGAGPGCEFEGRSTLRAADIRHLLAAVPQAVTTPEQQQVLWLMLRDDRRVLESLGRTTVRRLEALYDPCCADGRGWIKDFDKDRWFACRSGQPLRRGDDADRYAAIVSELAVLLDHLAGRRR